MYVSLSPYTDFLHVVLTVLDTNLIETCFRTYDNNLTSEWKICMHCMGLFTDLEVQYYKYAKITL